MPEEGIHGLPSIVTELFLQLTPTPTISQTSSVTSKTPSILSEVPPTPDPSSLSEVKSPKKRDVRFRRGFSKYVPHTRRSKRLKKCVSPMDLDKGVYTAPVQVSEDPSERNGEKEQSCAITPSEGINVECKFEQVSSGKVISGTLKLCIQEEVMKIDVPKIMLSKRAVQALSQTEAGEESKDAKCVTSTADFESDISTSSRDGSESQDFGSVSDIPPTPETDNPTSTPELLEMRDSETQPSEKENSKETPNSKAKGQAPKSQLKEPIEGQEENQVSIFSVILSLFMIIPLAIREFFNDSKYFLTKCILPDAHGTPPFSVVISYDNRI